VDLNSIKYSITLDGALTKRDDFKKLDGVINADVSYEIGSGDSAKKGVFKIKLVQAQDNLYVRVEPTGDLPSELAYLSTMSNVWVKVDPKVLNENKYEQLANAIALLQAPADDSKVTTWKSAITSQGLLLIEEWDNGGKVNEVDAWEMRVKLGGAWLTAIAGNVKDYEISTWVDKRNNLPTRMSVDIELGSESNDAVPRGGITGELNLTDYNGLVRIETPATSTSILPFLKLIK
jgi:hypothetical protein